MERMTLFLIHPSMTGNINRQTGLTLVEVLVATAIISITVVTAVGLWFRVTQSEDAVSDDLYLQGIERQVLQQIETQVRSGNIDYDYYAGTLDPQVLALRTSAGAPLAWWFDDTATPTRLRLCSGKAITLNCNTATASDWEQVTPDNVSLVTGSFAVLPTSSPYATGTSSPPSSNTAPLVTTTLQLQTADTITTPVQHTVTSRFYDR